MASVSATTELSMQARIASIGKLNYLDFFGFETPPFRNTTDVAEFFLNAPLNAALNEIEAVLDRSQGGVLLVHGTPGSGKTTLVNQVVDRRLDQASVAKINHTFHSEQDFLRALLHAFGQPSDGVDRQSLIQTFADFLDQQTQVGRHLILVVDEAHTLKAPILGLLSELLDPNPSDARESAPGFFIILLGQEECTRVLSLPEAAVLAANLSYQTALTPLDADDTSAYIRHQLQTAGKQARNPFTERAMARIQMLTGGSMRLINTLCDFVLFNACLGQIRRITPELVQTTFNALQWEPPRSKKDPGSPDKSGASRQAPRLILEFDRHLEFPLDKDVITIGRASDNDICIRDLRISRFHARLTTTRKGISIEDLGSTNGVYVNRERVKVRLVRDGDVIAIDNKRIRVILGGDA